MSIWRAVTEVQRECAIPQGLSLWLKDSNPESSCCEPTVLNIATTVPALSVLSFISFVSVILTHCITNSVHVQLASS